MLRDNCFASWRSYFAEYYITYNPFVVSGCRAALVNVEAQPVSALSFLRKCVVAKMKDLTIDRFKDAVQQNAGGLLVIVPSNLSRLSDSEKEVGQHISSSCSEWFLNGAPTGNGWLHDD